jgi:hypothetical protein
LKLPCPKLVSLIGTVLPLAGIACSDPTAIGECHGQVEITVAAGPPPVYRWTPTCRIGYLVVVDRGDQTQGFWSVTSAVGRNDIAPPVTHGVVPARATEEAGTQPLRTGGAYLVMLFLVQEDQDGGYTVVQAGEAPFNR